MQSDSEPIKIVTKNNGIQLNNWMMKVGKTNFEYFIYNTVAYEEQRS